MNIIAGWIRPEMNWARKRASYSSSFCSSKVCRRLALPAEDLDQRVAGEHLLDVAVELAGGPTARRTAAAPACRSRVVTSIDSGTVTSAISASSGEIQNIIASTPTMVSSDVMSWLIVCCRRLRDVVDVVGGPAEHLAARLLVEVAQRQPVQLRLDVLAQPAHGALHDVVEQAPAARRAPTPT